MTSRERLLTVMKGGIPDCVLVAAGVDGLNPIEILAGMDVGEIHRRHPRLFMAGGIDVSQLLPFGTPGQVRDAVRKAIDDAEGRILIGSSTELNEEVPLANFLALREAVLARAETGGDVHGQ